MYTIKQASQRSGVSVPLLRAWERRYAVVAPGRTPAGYRLYDDADIERLRAMRRLTEAGWPARQAAEEVEGTDPAALRTLAVEPTDRGSGAAPAGTEVADLLAAATSLDVARMEAALDEAIGPRRFEPAVEEVLLPALTEIGAAWARGELDVAAEHAAAAAIQRRLAMAYEAAGRGGGRPVLVGLPAGSRHELAALAFAVELRRAGVAVVYLGADVPTASWPRVVAETGARGVVLGVVMAEDVAAAAVALDAVAAAHPDVVRAVGGRHAAEVRSEGAVLLPGRLSAAVEALRAQLP